MHLKRWGDFREFQQATDQLTSLLRLIVCHALVFRVFLFEGRFCSLFRPNLSTQTLEFQPRPKWCLIHQCSLLLL